MAEERPVAYLWNGADCTTGSPFLYEGLGYKGKAAGIKKGTDLTFAFTEWKTDSVEIEIRLLPNHPVQGTQLRFAVTLDNGTTQVVPYETQGRSEEWKENVLRNQAIRRFELPVNKSKDHLLVIKELDEGVILDQVVLFKS